MSSFDEYVKQQERDPEFKALLDAERQRLRDLLDPPDDCSGCVAPRGYPPNGPCGHLGTSAGDPRGSVR